jgi:2-aminoethylphosphonate-pyruvate transaminase
MLQPDLCHREKEFFDLQDEVRRRLLSTYSLDGAEWSAVLMSASGTAAVESMVAALVPQAGKLLIIENGVYGDRIARICEQYEIPHERMVGDWMRPPDHAAVSAKLASAGARFTHVAVVHHETTTGRLNDLRRLASLCCEHGVGLLVDAVSSFGAELIDFNDAALCAVAATANKCLHGVPGVAFVIVRRQHLAHAASRTFYLDLARLARLQDERNTPFTPAVHAYYALVEALREYEEQGGRIARYRHYAALAEQVRSGLAALGIDEAIPAAESSVVLRAYRLSPGVAYDQLHDALKADGFVIYAGQGDLSKTLFRISTMGSLSAADIDRLIQSFSRIFR